MADQHADNAEHAYVHGSMEISEQVSTWHLFQFLAKWGSLLMAAVLLFLTVWFAVGAGFIAGAISAVALFVAGFFALRSKPAH
ncbi:MULTISPECIES: aa3-type cytochrome c oxidase subunit IV [unclassified Brevundimonas]|uniref:aa3-type cytochrome c oxidase subunit IV n=1 Tax=unclassified Brevundimonas TaxID=2622653 RepID=UPI003F922B40